MTTYLSPSPSNRVALLRHLIKIAGGEFFSLTFVKKDGTPRRLVCHLPTTASRAAGDAASASARKAVATRRERHPHLINLWSVCDGGYRSVDLRRVKSLVIRGEVIKVD